MAAITQQKYALWSRRYGSFAGKTETDVIVSIDVATVDLGATKAQLPVNWVAKTQANTANLGPTLRDQ